MNPRIAMDCMACAGISGCGVVDTRCSAEQDHAVLCAQFCRHLRHAEVGRGKKIKQDFLEFPLLGEGHRGCPEDRLKPITDRVVEIA
jgi:hypothetical protein